MRLYECCYKCDHRQPGCECDEYKADKAEEALIKLERNKGAEADRFLKTRTNRVRASKTLGGVYK